MPSPKGSNLPPDFYQKSREMFEQANKVQDPEARALALQAFHRYYEADIKESARLPLWALLVVLIVLYLLVLGTMIWAFKQLPPVTAAVVCIASYTFMSLLIGVVLRVSGYISETSLLGIWKAGFKTLSSLKGKPIKSTQ